MPPLTPNELQQDHLLPEEYVLTMRRTMLDQCPVSPYPEVARIVREDLGSTPEELFATFEHEPIASASLAQVRMPLQDLHILDAMLVLLNSALPCESHRECCVR